MSDGVDRRGVLESYDESVDGTPVPDRLTVGEGSPGSSLRTRDVLGVRLGYNRGMTGSIDLDENVNSSLQTRQYDSWLQLNRIYAQLLHSSRCPGRLWACRPWMKNTLPFAKAP